jgi:methyl-accepting chemotaxis protein
MMRLLKLWRNISIKQKILAASLLISIFMILVGYVTYKGIGQVQFAYKQAINKEYKQAFTVLQMRLAASKQQAFLNKAILLGTKGDDRQYQVAAEELERRLSDLNSLVMAEEIDLTKIQQNVKSFQQYSQDARIALSAGKSDQAIDILLDKLESTSNEQSLIMEQLSAQALNSVSASINRAELASNNTVLRVYLLLALGILVVSIIAILVVFSITRPLNESIELTSLVADGELKVEYQTSDEKNELATLRRSFSRLVIGLQSITNSIEYIAGGDLSVVVEPRSKRGTLSMALGRMVQSLHSIVANVRASCEQVKNISTELATSGQQLEIDTDMVATAVEDMAAVVVELSQNVRAIARSTEAQSASVVESTTATQQMAARMQTIAENAKELTHIVDDTRNVVKDGRVFVEQAAAGMREINSSINTTADTMRELGERANDIGRIVEVINNISDQINLLALNAAIEAARAGTYGLGFGVVAEEVRKLSERTANAVDEIAQVINRMQKGVSQTVKHMESSTNKVGEGLGQSAKLVNTLGQIETVVGSVAKTSTHIESIIMEQLIGIEEMLKSMRNLTMVTEEIHAASQEQAVSTSEIVKSVEQVRNSTQRNAKLSEKLSAAGQSILAQSQHLEQGVRVFRLPGEAAHFEPAQMGELAVKSRSNPVLAFDK